MDNLTGTNKMDCNEAFRILTEMGEHDDKALDSIVVNPRCLARVEQLLQDVGSVIDDDGFLCSEVQMALSEYYEVQRQKGTVVTEMPGIYTHLRRFHQCQLEYRLLQSSMDAFYNNELPTVGESPQFNLSFLKPESLSTDIWQIMGHVRSLLEEIKITVSQSAAVIRTSIPHLEPIVVTPRMQFRSAGDESEDENIEYSRLLLPDEDVQIQFLLDAKPLIEGQALITFTMIESDSDKPISGARVAIRKIDGMRVLEEITQKNGEIVFNHSGQDRYIVKVQYKGQEWELPLAISSVP